MEVHEFVGVFLIVAARPASGRKWRAFISRAVFACLVLIALDETPARAQSVTPDLFNPRRTTQVAPDNLAIRQISGSPSAAVLDPNATLDPNAMLDPKATFDPNSDPNKRKANQPAESRIGKVPVYGLPAASGAADSGYDSLNGKRKPPKYYPGQAKPKPPVGPGNPPLPVASGAPQRLSIPPSQTANKTPIAPSMAGTVVGQPLRKRLKVDDDPFGAVGDYAGSFLIK